jgi:rhodanese-related sulfurtransferase
VGKQHNPQFLKLVSDTRPKVRECTVADVQAKLAAGDPFLLIDVREEGEFAAGHIPNAAHIGKGVLERDIETKVPDPTTPLVLYCGGGYRSVLAAEVLGRMGYTDVVSMDGGWTGWTRAGGAVER